MILAYKEELQRNTQDLFVHLGISSAYKELVLLRRDEGDFNNSHGNSADLLMESNHKNINPALLAWKSTQAAFATWIRAISLPLPDLGILENATSGMHST